MIGLASSLLSLGDPAFSANWIAIGESSDGAPIFVDDSTIVQTGDLEKAWIKFDYSRLKEKAAREAKSQISVNCAQSTMIVLSKYEYAVSGAVLRSYSAPSYGISYSPIIPESVGETIAKYLCRAEPPPK